MKKLLALLLALIMVFSLAACQGGGDDPTTDPGTNPGDPTNPDDPTVDQAALEAAKYGGHLDILIESKPAYLDPSKSTGVFNYMWTSLVWEPPLTRDAEGNIRPNVCDFELSEDMLTLKLWVREGVTFHDGSAVEIEDVVASIKRAVHKSPRSYVAAFIQDVQIENGVATITFTEYNEKTMYYIACPNAFLGVMPKEIAEEFSYESGNFILEIEDAIGTGPYKITDFEPSVFVSFERFEDYTPVEGNYTGFAGPKKAYLDSITFTYKADQASGNMALMNGEYDLSEGVAEDFYPQLESVGIINDAREALNILRVEFNTCNGSIFATSADMRKAVMAAIDIPELVEVSMKGRYTTKAQLCSDTLYQNDDFETADYMGEDNVTLSKQYQEKAGYNGEVLHMIWGSGAEDFYTLICTYLEAAGIAYEVDQVENTTKTERINNPDDEWNLNLDFPSVNSTPGMMSATLIDHMYESETKDTLFAELGGLLAGTPEYKAKWEELSALMVDECAVIPIGTSTLVWSMDPDFNLEFDGYVTYLFNSYWTNPEDHPVKN